MKKKKVENDLDLCKAIVYRPRRETITACDIVLFVIALVIALVAAGLIIYSLIAA